MILSKWEEQFRNIYLPNYRSFETSESCLAVRFAHLMSSGKIQGAQSSTAVRGLQQQPFKPFQDCGGSRRYQEICDGTPQRKAPR